MRIGPGAFVSSEFELADDVQIGAGAQLTGAGTIGPGVRIGHGTVIEGLVHIGCDTTISHHVFILGHVTLGAGNEIGHGSTIGGGPEHPDHLHSDGEIRIGDRNVFRERCTVNMPTTEPLTIVGNDNYFMHGVHVAHDCRVGDHVKIAPLTTLAGHVEVDDFAYIGLHVAVHQRRHIGAHCMVGMISPVMKHLPPFATLIASQFTKVNAHGLRLRGFSDEEIAQIQIEYGFQEGPRAQVPQSTACELIRRFLASHDPHQTYLPQSAAVKP